MITLHLAETKTALYIYILLLLKYGAAVSRQLF